jgi:hypothetical protein
METSQILYDVIWWILGGSALAILGLWRENQNIKKEIAEFRLSVARDYVRNNQFLELSQKIDKKIDFIIERLNDLKTEQAVIKGRQQTKRGAK